MRTFTITNTNTDFGLAQDRVVKANREGCAPAQPHLMSRGWHPEHANPAREAAKALKRLVADAVTGTVRILGSYLPISGRQLCRMPVQSTRLHASVRG